MYSTALPFARVLHFPYSLFPFPWTRGAKLDFKKKGKAGGYEEGREGKEGVLKGCS